jgi:peptide/nickel transport system permease protein
MEYLRFLTRRLIQAVAVMFIISVIGFSIQDNLGEQWR